ncbi:MAG: protein kinase domain-containing protein [Bacteroidota bacterium]
MIGQTISHYKILEKLGEGGMGVVYKAQDTKLDRLVALKFLPHHLTSSEAEQSRLLQEAKAAAALNHPNACSVIDIQEANGEQFIVMEYVDGVTLRQKSPVAKVNDAIAYAIQIGEALHEAHSKGIVHRDIKCENIMVNSRNQIKVMDFGLAKLKGSLKLTKASSTVGTLAYMAPEQIQGGEVDGRSDIFSFGVVLFEMLTGKTPFRGEHDAAIMYSILNEEPEPLTKYQPDASSDLLHIINRALEKDPADRYQRADDMVNELRRLQKTSSRVVRPEQMTQSRTTQTTSFPVASPRKSNAKLWIAAAAIVLLTGTSWFLFFNKPEQKITSMAVLPFVNAGSDQSAEYLSDGFTESLINSLSKLPGVKMMSRNSVFRYKGKDIDPQVVGKELSVDAVLLGRITQNAGALIVSVELVNTSDNSHMWGEQYERKASGIITLQNEISRELSKQLSVTLTGEQENQITKNATENTEAYHLYLKGRYYWAKRTAENLSKAVAYFNESIQSDPGYALAYSGLADAYIILGVFGEQSPAEAFPRAKAAASKALEIDPSLAEAYASLGDISIHYDWDWIAAGRNLSKAIELDSRYATAHHWNSEYLTIIGRHDEAIAETRKAAELDPLSLIINTFVGWNYYCARKNDSAVVALNKALEIDREFSWAHLYLGWSYLQMQKLDEAINHLLLATQSYENPQTLASLGRAYAMAGRTRNATNILDTLTNLSKKRFVSAYNFSLVTLGLGQKDKTFEWLLKAYQERASWLFMIKIDPSWDSLRDDPRFSALLKKMDLEE